MAANPRERPILFSSPMVRAILEGRKTQTRRVMKIQPRHDWHPEVGYCAYEQEDGNPGPDFFGAGDEIECYRCPYGAPGDRLWVRETHIRRGDRAMYRADVDPVEAAGLGGMYGGWTPSIFMFRKHSRITLEIADVRVQRLQEITEQDARAEGVEPNWCGDLKGWNPEEHGWIDYLQTCEDSDPCWTAKDSFQSLWQSINAKRGFGWDVNPWVWASTFRVEEPTA
jgi:hypothetical protein